MKPVTLWFRKIEKTGDVVYNHLEYGHCENDTPTPVSKEQEKSWKNETWIREYKHITDDYKVVD